ncbi:hypothetical protein GCM10007390_19320 [Persicitalea jodogahamensis]|uniref:YdhG-like domain-containing protein n=2 Tax=Persicitalea jodogahamensis TaxID=402147 RepID=A0A8J3D663_9BACT|nr:hypothetical protein GCM10007390_19320 [Persicitalea jodogahamensis]
MSPDPIKTQAEHPDKYLAELPEDRRVAMEKLRDVLRKNLPAGFIETMNYGMIGYVVPHLLYPPGYHCDPEQPLPFINIASQKNWIAVYHMGLYADEKLIEWFKAEFPKYSRNKLDMGKSCIRFKKTNEIPYELIGDLAGRMSAEEWIAVYEKNLKR